MKKTGNDQLYGKLRLEFNNLLFVNKELRIENISFNTKCYSADGSTSSRFLTENEEDGFFILLNDPKVIKERSIEIILPAMNAYRLSIGSFEETFIIHYGFITVVKCELPSLSTREVKGSFFED